MSLQTCVGSFTQISGTGTQAITGVGFTPKALLFYSTGQVTFAGTCAYRLGFDDGTTHVGVAVNAGDFLGTYDASETSGSDAYSLVTNRNSAANQINALGYVSALGADGFTVTWTQNLSNWSAGTVWIYLAIGGAGVSAKVGTMAIPVAPGASSVTGLTFTPSTIFTSFHPFTPGGTDTGGGAAGTLGLGVATSCETGQWAVAGTVTSGANPSSTSTYQQHASAFSAATVAAVTIAGAVTAWNSGGWTVTWSTVPGVNHYFGYLALGGVAANVGRFTQPTSTGTQRVTFTAGQPKAVLVASADKAASASITANCLLSVGAATSGSQQAGIWTGDLSGKAAPTWDHYAYDSALAISRIPTASNASSATTFGALTDLVEGSFTLNWTTVDSTAREWQYVVLADATSSGVCGALAPLVTTTRAMRLVRRFLLAYQSNLQITITRLEILLQAGVGLSIGQGSDPVVMLRVSKDGGHTWGNEIQLSMGPMGAYTARAYCNMLGRGRHWVAEVVVSDPVLVGLLDCVIDYSVGTS